MDFTSCKASDLGVLNSSLDLSTVFGILGNLLNLSSHSVSIH